MTQTTLSPPEKLHPALIRCPTCDHAIPKSCNVCLWCGANRGEVK